METLISTEHLVDREQIREVLYRFAEGLDTRDWALIGSLCDATVDADFTVWGIPRQQLQREAFVGLFQASFWRPALQTQHLYTNFRIEIVERRATVVFNFLGHHLVAGFPDGEEFHLRGEYTDELVWTEAGWKIARVRLKVFSAVGAARIVAPDVYSGGQDY